MSELRGNTCETLLEERIIELIVAKEQQHGQPIKGALHYVVNIDGAGFVYQIMTDDWLLTSLTPHVRHPVATPGQWLNWVSDYADHIIVSWEAHEAGDWVVNDLIVRLRHG